MRIICGRRGSGVRATEKSHGTGGLLFYASIPWLRPRHQLLLYLMNSDGVVHLTFKILFLSLCRRRSHNSSRAAWVAKRRRSATHPRRWKTPYPTHRSSSTPISVKHSFSTQMRQGRESQAHYIRRATTEKNAQYCLSHEAWRTLKQGIPQQNWNAWPWYGAFTAWNTTSTALNLYTDHAALKWIWDMKSTVNSLLFKGSLILNAGQHSPRTPKPETRSRGKAHAVLSDLGINCLLGATIWQRPGGIDTKRSLSGNRRYAWSGSFDDPRKFR